MKRTGSANVPAGMKVQLARLFGSTSAEASRDRRSTREWRRTLLLVLRELDQYLSANVDTDEVHLLMMRSGLYAAHESLKREDFWPGYAEGITRLALTLMGNYPDHRPRKLGRKRENHYLLSRQRSVRYVQTVSQRLNTLLDAPAVGIKLSASPWHVLMEFRRQFGQRPSRAQFLSWYKRTYPEDYVLVFQNPA